MTITRDHFVHPQKAEKRLSLILQLKSEFGIVEDDCYASAGLERPYLTDHSACARVLSRTLDLLKDIEDGKYQYQRPDGKGFMEDVCLIESKEEFLAELKKQLS